MGQKRQGGSFYEKAVFPETQRIHRPGLRPSGGFDVRGGERPGSDGLGHPEAATHLLRPAGSEDDRHLFRCSLG